MSKQLEQLVKELFELVDSVECSDNNRYFHPTSLQFASCRAMTGHRIGQIINEMKEIVGAPPRMSEKEMYLLNNPDGCGECLGKGHHSMVECKVCGGSGSTDPTVPMICTWCNGTGDKTNHERYSDDCQRCDRQGRVWPCKDCKGDKCDKCGGHGVIPAHDW